MSSIITAVIIISIVALTLFLLISLHNKETKKKKNALVSYFNHHGMINSFAFSCQEILRNCIIGLDGLQRKLMILEYGADENHKHVHIIDLNKVNNCGFQKIFSASAETEKGKKSELYLEKIQLKFDYASHNLPVEVVFYDHISNHIYEIAELEQKAKDWQNIMNKIITPSNKQIA